MTAAMKNTPRPVDIVEDDPAVAEVLANAVSGFGYTSRLFDQAEDALQALEDQLPACVLVDLELKGSLGGLDLVNALKAREPKLPVIIISGTGNIDAAVQAMRAGARDFIEKPFTLERLKAALDECLAPAAPLPPISLEAMEALLTRREKEVLEGICQALSNKLIGGKLGISSRTVEIHRANLMQKLNVHNVAGLLRLAFRVDEPPPTES